MDPEVAQELAKAPPPEIGLSDLAAFRSAWDTYIREQIERAVVEESSIVTEDISIPSLGDDHSIPVRIYRPAAAPAPGPGLLYIHGGAFLIGDLEFEDARCRSFAARANCTIVSVDYRLAPEHPFPIPLDDCRSALHWLVEQAPELAVDPARIGVGGCSAGGALAASLAQVWRDTGGSRLALQMLLYPVLDASLSTDAIRALDQELFEEGVLIWEHYLGGPRSEAPKYASPASCEDLSGLPPAYIVAGEFDELRDETIAYAQRLLSAGVNVELHLWGGAPHAFEIFATGTELGQQVIGRQVEALTRYLG